MNNYVRNYNVWSTGGFALGYLAGTQRLAMLGRKDSVFATNPPAALKTALDLYHAKDFEASARAASKIADQSAAGRVHQLATQLAEAAQRNLRSIELTLASMQADYEAEDLYQLQQKLKGIEGVVDVDDPRLREFRAAVEDPKNKKRLDVGKIYYARVNAFELQGQKGFERIEMLGGRSSHRWIKKQWSGFMETAKSGIAPYQQWTRNFLLTHPYLMNTSHRLALLKLAADKAKQDNEGREFLGWQFFQGDEVSSRDWMQPSFRNLAWSSLNQPSEQLGGEGTSHLRGVFEIADPGEVEELSISTSATGPMKVFLNGELVFHYTGKKTSWSSFGIPLKPVTRELLREGTNCLAIESSALSDQFKLSFFAHVRGEPR